MKMDKNIVPLGGKSVLHPKAGSEVHNPFGDGGHCLALILNQDFNPSPELLWYTDKKSLSWPVTGVSLPGPCLAIGKHRGVVPLERRQGRNG